MDLKRELAKMDNEALAIAYVQISTIVGTPQSKTYPLWSEIFEMINEENTKRLIPGNAKFTNNLTIRNEISRRGLKMKAVADRLGIASATFSRWLQTELPKEKQTEILQVIDSM